MKKGLLLLLLTIILFSSSLSNAEGPVVEVDGVKYEVYLVKKGDTLWGIAKNRWSDPHKWHRLISANRYIRDANVIYPGQPILVPAEELEKAAAAKEEAVAVEEKSLIESVAVTSFINSSDGGNFDWLSIGLAESLATDMKKFPGLTVIEREGIEQILKENKLRDLNIVEYKEKQELGRFFASSHLLGGSYRVDGDMITIKAALLDVKKDEVIGTTEISGKISNIFELERLMLMNLLSKFMEVDDAVKASILAGEKTTLAAFEQVSKGKSLFYLGQSKEAREYFQKALETDPKYQAALQELKESVSSSDTLAIMPMKNATGSKELEWLSLGISEALSTDIKKMTGIFLVERAQIEKALEELKLGTLGIVDEKTAPQLGKMVGAGIILIGSYQTVNGNIRIDVRMVDVVSSQVLLTETVNGDIGKIFEVETGLAERIAKALHVELSPEEREKLMSEKPDIESFKRYIMAQGTVEVVTKKPGEGVTAISAMALTDFDNSSKIAEYDWMKSAIPGSLYTELKAKSKINLIERNQIDKALEEMKLASIGLIEENAPKLGKMLGADAVLTGIYQISGDSIRIDAKIVKVETGEVLSGGEVSGSIKEIFNLEKRLAENVLAALEALAPKDEKAKEEEQKVAEKEDEAKKKKDELMKLEELKEKQRKKRDEEAIKDINIWLNTVQ